MVWKLIKRKLATLTELESTWSYDDLQRGVAFLDICDHMEKQEVKKDV
jgi:hypothetical protein